MPPLSLRQRLSCCRDCLQLQFGHVRQTLTSMVENQCSVGDRKVPLIDVPGHPRLRESIRGKYARQAKRVVFVIDSKEFKDTSRNMKRFFIGFMPIGLGCIAWIEFGGLDWSRVLSNLAYAAFGSLILALIHKFSQP